MSPAQHIRFACPQCSKQLRAPVHAAGRNAKCKSCGAAVCIPSSPTNGQSVLEPAADDHRAKVAKQSARSTSQPAAEPKRRQAAAKRRQQQTRTSEPQSTQSNNPHAVRPISSVDLQAATAEAEQQAHQQATAKQAAKVTPQQISRAFTDKLPKRSVSMAYRIHLLLAAAAVAALPIVYLALVICAAIGEYYYVVHLMPTMLSNAPGGRAIVFYFGLVIAPAIAGFVVVLFLIKPMFFRTRQDGRRRSLTRKGEPVLFHLVDKICESTGAPKPVRIDVDYQVNASAQPAGGLFSAVAGRMVLTIGVPLIAGLSTRQLAGVLAHEFGHFSQKIGMGATLVIRRVNWWFTRVVYQRDSLDVALDEAIQDSDARIGLILQLAQVCVFLSRGVLWCFMMVSHAISSGLLRQMEFDADRYEYGLVGSKTFEATSHELAVLGQVQMSALDDMFAMFSKGRLADDLLLLSDVTRQSISATDLHAIRKSNLETQTSWLATHPSNKARIDRAGKANAAGVFQLDLPARELIQHYKSLCKNVTWDFYRDQLGSRISPQHMTRTEDLLAAPIDQDDADRLISM